MVSISKIDGVSVLRIQIKNRWLSPVYWIDSTIILFILYDIIYYKVLKNNYNKEVL